MKTLNKFFAVVFLVLSIVAMYGVLFCSAHWHIVTAFMCGFLSLIFFADNNQPKNTGLSAK